MGAETLPSRSRSVALRLATFGLLLAAYLAGATYQAFRINLDLRRTDQSAYIEYARRMATSGYTHVGDRARMPVYPFLMSLLHRPGMSDEEFFRIGKAVVIAMSLGLLLLAWVLLAVWVEPLAATAVVSVAAFTVFMFKAGHFQAELLFYFLNLLLFVLFVENLLRPTAARAAVLGVVAGLAHLTKASVLPAIGLFVVCFVARSLAGARRIGARRVVRQASYAALFLAVFLATVFPYIRTSKGRFGSWFYNVTTTFYVWYDSWEQVEHGTKAHGDRVGWPRMSRSDIPSAARYLREHSASEIVERIGRGLRRILSVASNSYGYLEYVAFYLAVLGLLGVANRRRLADALRHPGAGAAFLFAAAYFLGYLLLYAWYVPIADGNRLTLSLLLPGLAAAAYFLDRVIADAPVRFFRSTVTPTFVHRVVLMALCLDVVLRLSRRVTTISGAD